MSRTVGALAFTVLASVVACSDGRTMPSAAPSAIPGGPMAQVAGSWTGTVNELECGPLTIGHCYTWLKTPPPRMWKFAMQLSEDGSQVTGSFSRLDDTTNTGTVKGHLRPESRVELVVSLWNRYSVTALNNFNAIVDSGNVLEGTADYVLGSETRRSEVKATRQ